MGKIQTLKKNGIKIWEISRINIKIKLRFKASLILGFISPLIATFLPLFLMGYIFSNNINQIGSIGVFNADNYISLILLGVCGSLLNGLFLIYQSSFVREKNWRTLPALIISPSNRLSLLLGILLSYLIINSIPFFVVFVINLIVSPIIPSIGSLSLILLVFLLYSLTLSGLGLILGVFSISKQNWQTLFLVGYQIVILFNCVTYPKEIFPESIHFIIDLNPFYHFFETNRLLWVYDNPFYSEIGVHFLIVVILAILSPIIGIILFNKIYNKFGIEGF